MHTATRNKKIVLCIITFLVIALYKAKTIHKLSIGYVLNKYQIKMRDRECLFYPAKNPKRLLIFFTGLKKNTYIMWSWFWREQEDWDDTAYLFLKDDDFCWYLGNSQQSFVEDYSAIINTFMERCKLSKEKVFTIGGSMGGYAAILYATRLGLKAAIAINPQVNKASKAIRGFDDIGNKWQELEQVVAASQTVPDISLIYSYCPRDQAAGNALLDVIKQKGSLVILRRHDSDLHTGGANLTKEFIETEIDYLEKQDRYKTTIRAV